MIINKARSFVKDSSLQPLPFFIVGLSILIVILLHLPLSVYPLGRDQGFFATYGMALDLGKLTYLPGMSVIYWILQHLSDNPSEVTMMVNLAGSILTIISIYLLLSETISRSAGAWSALLFAILWPTYIDFWDIAQKDFMGLSGVIFATWLVARAKSDTRYRSISLYLAGFSVGISILFKPVYGVAGLLLAFSHVVRFLKVNRIFTDRDWTGITYLIRDLFFLLAGAVTVLGIMVYCLYAQGQFEHNYNNLFLVIPSYLTLNVATADIMLYMLNIYPFHDKYGDYDTIWVKVYFWLPLVIVGFCLLLRKDFGDRRWWLLVPVVTTLATYFMQGKGWTYHLAPFQVCLFMIAGTAMSWLWSKRADINPNSQQIITLVRLYLTLGMLYLVFRSLFLSHFSFFEVEAWKENMTREQYLGTYADRRIPHPLVSETLAAWIKENTTAEQTILVWGLESQLYALSNRHYATSFPNDFQLSIDLPKGSPGEKWQSELRKKFMREIGRDKPAFIIITHHDATAVEPVPSNETVSLVPGFVEYINNNYKKELEYERFEVFRRTSP